MCYFLLSSLEDLEGRKKITILILLVPCAVMFPYFFLQVTSEKQFSLDTLKGEGLYQVKAISAYFGKDLAVQARASPWVLVAGLTS